MENKGQTGFEIPPSPTYDMSYTLLSGDVDVDMNLRLPVMFRLFQDIAGLHSNNLGAGVEYLADEHRATWVLVRAKAEIARLPGLFENIRIRTWPQAPARVYNRDYCIFGEDGEVAVRSSSVWVIMNIDTRDIITGPIVDFSEVDFLKERALGGALPRFRGKPDDPSPVYEKTLRFSDMDYNGHANNTKYVEFAADAFSVDEMRQKRMKSIEINFDHEASEGETLQINRADIETEPSKVYVDGTLKGDGKCIFRSVFEF
jgi:acyl-ACP thioesterase